MGHAQDEQMRQDAERDGATDSLTKNAQRWLVTSTWGCRHVLATSESEAEDLAEEWLNESGHGEARILDGLTIEYDARYHGEWQGDADEIMGGRDVPAALVAAVVLPR